MLGSLIIITTSLLAIFAFGLGIISIYKHHKSKLVIIWFLNSIAITVWGVGLLLVMLSSTESAGVLYSKLLHVGASFIPIFFYSFVLDFLFFYDIKKRFFGYIGYGLAFLFAILSLTNKIVLSASPKLGFATWVDAGELYPLFLLYFGVYIIVPLYFLYQRYKQSDGVVKRKIFYIIIAALIGFGGGSTNFLPQTLGIYPYGQLVVWLYPILVYYGIFMDEIKIKIKF